MKKFGLLFLGLVGGIFLTLSFLWTGATRNSLADPRAQSGRSLWRR